MNSEEREEIEKLPSEYRPIGAWGYFGYSLLFSIPIVGFIFLIVFSCVGDNINRRSFARSYFCGFLVFAIVLLLVWFVFGTAIFTAIKDYASLIQ